MRYFTFAIIVLFLSPLQAQFDTGNYTLNLVPTNYRENYSAARLLNQVTQESLSSDYTLTYRSSIKVKPKINTGKAHLIEGMDIKATGNPQIEFHISDEHSKVKDKFVYSEKISARSTASLAIELVKSFESNLESQEELSDFIQEFLDKLFSENCDKYTTYVNELNEDQKYEKSISALLNYAQSNCPGAKDLLKSTLKLQAENCCKEKIQQVSVLANSGVEFQMKRAIPILLSISPNSSCASEAIELSKVIGEKMDKTSKYSVEISKYMSNKNYSDWESYYLRKFLQEEKTR